MAQNNFIIAPVNPTETWQSRFADRGYATPQASIDAGYVYMAQPTAQYGTWVYVKDYGATIASTLVKLSYLREDIVGEIVIKTHLAYSLDGIAWTEIQNVSQIFATNFRYIRVTFEFGTLPSGTPMGVLAAITVDPSGAGFSDKNFAVIRNIRLKLDSKIIKDSGMDEVTVAASGKVVTFNREFIDVRSILVTPAGDGSAVKTPLYDFVDTPNPTQMTVYLLDGTGTKTTGEFSWYVEGI